jgi:hypothetical protein
VAGVLAQDAYQFDNTGVHFGHRYEGSPVVWSEPADPPAWRWQRIVPGTWPGGRAPAVRLGDGAQLFDRLGTGLTLVDTSAAGTGLALVARAEKRGIPMAYLRLDDPAVRACWERDLVLVRPDQHVAWRAGAGSADWDWDWDAVLDRVTGRATTRSRHVTTGPAEQTLAR